MKFEIIWKVFSFFLITQLLQGCVAKEEQDTDQQPTVRSFTYNTLSDYQRTLFDDFIESMFPEGSSLDQVMADDVSIRSTTRLALALLFRDDEGDRENAIEILKWILKHQHLDEKAKIYGAWKTSVQNDKLDQNWREFVGCDLIIIYHNHRDLLPDELLEKIKNGLVHAAIGAMKRDVTPQYTNISVMSAFLMNYVGTAFDNQELKAAGTQKAHDINTLFHRHNTFSEFNSPTYDGVSLVGFALWRELSQGEMKSMGINLEQSVWKEIAAHYHPTLKNISGPYFRAYGMDMKKYVSIAGLWIAIALDDETRAPMPNGKGAKYFEVSNIAPIYHLGLSISESTFQVLKGQVKPAFLDQRIPNSIFAGDSIKHATFQMNQNWMMGGLWGNRRSWNQIYTGTVHWMSRKDETEWLLVPGNGHTNVSVSDSSMRIFTVESDPDHSGERELKLYVYSSEASEEHFSGDIWRLGNMQFNIHTDLFYNYAEIINPSPKNTQSSISEYYSKVAEISFKIPENWEADNPLIEIFPRYVLTQNPK
ncbi:MAG: hypothetical protein RID25_16310 [Cyclobacteriaceae bacterium]